MTLDQMRYLEIPLPEDIEKAKWCGDFERAQRLIRRRLDSGKLPFALVKRLELETEILRRLPRDYIYSEEEGLQILQEHIPGFTAEEMRELEDNSQIDWIYRDGKPYFCHSFYDTLVTVYPDIARRAGEPDQAESDNKRLLRETVAEMQEKGRAGRHIRLRGTLRVADEAFRPGEPLRVHLPIPAPAVNMANIRVTGWSPQQAVIAPETEGQRTICFACAPQVNIPFTVECEYDSIAAYHALDPEKVFPIQPDFDTQEQAPHIRFTPFLRALCRELSAGETNPLLLARRFYDYCTTKVTYSFMREYFTITQIPEYAALNQKGDCGVQALLFITLCRCAGIPARWQSGLYVTPYEAGSHDWAQFYIAPYGWLFADPSFGGSAYRAGSQLLHQHYFGNLDPYRMAANSQFQWEFDPPKDHLRSDPTDNQQGEAEYPDRSLSRQELDCTWEVLEMHPLD